MSESQNPTPELEGLAIVLIGHFNPRIFQPAWFAAERLVRESEAEEADVHVIHKDVSEIVMGKFTIQVTPERFLAVTSEVASYEPLRDLVVSTFGQLRHTPIQQLGINFDFHFRSDGEEKWHAIGHRLAPKEPWQDILATPGMRSISMQGMREDGRKGYIGVRVEPSVRLMPGVYVGVNNHIDVGAGDEVLYADLATNALAGAYELAQSQARKIAVKIAGLQ